MDPDAMGLWNEQVEASSAHHPLGPIVTPVLLPRDQGSNVHMKMNPITAGAAGPSSES